MYTIDIHHKRDEKPTVYKIYTKEEADIFPPEGTKDEALSTDF